MCGSMNAGRMVCNVRWHHTKVIMWYSEERGWGCIISNNKLHKQTISQGHSDLRVNGKSGSGDQGRAAFQVPQISCNGDVQLAV